MAQTPTPSIPTLTPGSDAGSSDTDGITDIGTPTLSGTAAPGALARRTVLSGANGGLGTDD